MPVNPYISKGGSGSQQVVENLTIEIIKRYGYDIYYLPRESINIDEIFNEEDTARFTSEYVIEMYFTDVDGFGGEGDFLSKIGIDIRDEATLIVSRKRFKETVPTMTRPKEGDLIYFPLSRALLEITNVEHENPFYQVGKLFAFELKCKLFRYGNEEISTGIEDIDSVDDRLINNDDVVNNLFADNDELEAEAAEHIDPTKNNPFGDW